MRLLQLRICGWQWSMRVATDSSGTLRAVRSGASRLGMATSRSLLPALHLAVVVHLTEPPGTLDTGCTLPRHSAAARLRLPPTSKHCPSSAALDCTLCLFYRAWPKDTEYALAPIGSGAQEQ